MALLLAPLRIATAVLGLLSGHPGAGGAPGPFTAAPLFDLVFAAFRRIENLLVNQPPTASPTQTSQSATGVITGALHAVDPNGDPLRYTLTANPAHGTATVATDGTYTYTPATAFTHTGGTDTFTVTADDSAGFHLFSPAGHTTAIPVSVTVAPVNHAPTVALSTTHNGDGSTTVTVTTTDADADAVTTTASAINGHGTLSATSTGYLYTPDPLYAHGLTAGGSTVPGADTVSVTGNDGHGGTATATAAVRVDGANTAPTLTLSAAGNHATGTTTVTVATADVDTPTGPDPITVTVATNPAHGTLTAQLDGTYRYTPQTGYLGTDSVTFTAADGHGGYTQHSITLDPTNHAPTLAVTPTVNTDGSTTLTVTTADVDGDTVTTTAASTNGDGTLTAAPTGYTYTPGASSSHATDSVTITATDTHTATATSTLTVSAIPPARTNPVITVGQPDPTTGVVTGTVTLPGATHTITYTLTTPPPPALGTVTVGSSTGNWTYTPTLPALYGAYIGQTVSSTAVFTITASGGQASTPIAVSAPVGVPTDALIAMLQRVGSRPSAVAVGTDGTIYVTNSGASTLTILNPTNSTKTTVTVGLSPTAVGVGPDGHIWVANTGDNTVSELTAAGDLYQGPVRVGQAPAGIAFGADGNAYVANSVSGTVSVIDPKGGGVLRTVSVGTNPLNLAAGPDGRIYAANYGSGTITIIDPSTGYATTSISAGATHPYGIVVSPTGTIYLTDPVASTLTTLTPAVPGGYASTIATIAGGPSAITISATGELYLADTNAGTVTTLDPSTGAASTTAVGTNPLSLAVASDGTVYSVNAGNNTLAAFTAGGKVEAIDVTVDTATIAVRPNGDLLAVSNYDGTIAIVPKTPVAETNYDQSTWSYAFTTAYGLASAAGPDGTVYVARNGYSSAEVGAYTPGGTFIGGYEIPGFLESVTGLSVGPDNQVYVIYDGNVYVSNLSGTSDHSYRNPFQRINYSDGTPILATTVTAGPEGRVFLTLTQGNGSLAIINSADLSVLDKVTLPVTADLYVPHQTALGADGSLLLARGSTLGVVKPDDSILAVALPTPVSHAAVGADGRIYLLNDDGRSVTVLNTDYSYASTVDLGGVGNDIVTGIGGRIFVQTAHGVESINPADYSLNATTVQSANASGATLGTAAGLAGSSDAVYVLASASVNPFYSQPYFMNRIVEHVPSLQQTIPPTDPSQPSPATIIESGFSDTGDLYHRLRERTDTTLDANNGIYLEKVSSGGEERLIAYLGGTTPSAGFGSGQTFLSNAVSALGVLKTDQTNLIDTAISNCPKCAGIMLVGYSQGGIDAQNLAMHIGKTLKTTVVTFGSPILQMPDAGQPTIHIQDFADGVPELLDLNPFASSSGAAAALDGDVYRGYSGKIGVAVHGDEETYVTLGREFDYVVTDAKYMTVKTSIADFMGDVVYETRYRGYTPSTLPSF